MGELLTRVYRNDSNQDYTIPGLGEVKAGQRVTFHGEFPPAINLQNFPGLVDVLEEEANGTFKDYEKEPEPAYDPAPAGGQVSANGQSVEEKE